MIDIVKRVLFEETIDELVVQDRAFDKFRARRYVVAKATTQII